jgi:large subunit ribosomal protein L25
MERVKLNVQTRGATGSHAAKRLREQGFIPGVLYGAGKPAQPFAVRAHDLRDALSTEAGRHAVLDVVFEGKKRGHVAVLKDTQLDKVKGTLTHIDLQEIHLNEPIETKVEIRLEGVAPGVKAGGIVDIVHHEVAVRGLPADIPEHVTLLVDSYNVGDVAHVRDVTVPDGLAVLDDPETVVLSIIGTKVTGAVEAGAEEEAAAEETSAEPQLVGKRGEEAGAED